MECDLRWRLVEVLGFLTLLLVILKIANVINWDWIWVFSPLWLPVLILVLTIGVFSVMVIATALLYLVISFIVEFIRNEW